MKFSIKDISSKCDQIHRKLRFIYTLAINLLQRLHRQLLQFYYFIFALKSFSDEESFIAMGTFCHN